MYTSIIYIISLTWFIYESGTYDSKLFKMVQMYWEKVVARYDPPTMLSGGHHPTAFSKVGNWGGHCILYTCIIIFVVVLSISTTAGVI